MADDIYLTLEGHEKLLKELKRLKTVVRKKLSEAIEVAREHGDLSENADYDAAKDAQALNEKRIADLEDKLSRAQIIDNRKLSNKEVLIGATVKIRDLDSGEEIEYTLVSETEADYEQNKISVSSPVGRGLLGHKVNSIVEIEVPAGALRYKIMKITR